MDREGAKDLSRALGGACEWAAPAALEAYFFGNDFVDCGRKINKKIVFEVPGGPCKIGVVSLGKVSDAVYKRQEEWTQTPKRLNDTRDNGFALCGRI